MVVFFQRSGVQLCRMVLSASVLGMFLVEGVYFSIIMAVGPVDKHAGPRQY